MTSSLAIRDKCMVFPGHGVGTQIAKAVWIEERDAMNEQPSENVRLTSESEALAREIEEGLIAYASPDARMEWDALRARWPWSGQRRPSADASLDDEPEVVIVKVRRFRAILGSISARQSASA